MSTKPQVSTAKVLLIPVAIMIILGLVLFLPAGSMHFWQAWIYWLTLSFLTFFIAVYFVKRDPAFLGRRMKRGETEVTHQPPAFLNLFFIGFLIPGLDFRFHWSAMPVWLVVIANLIVFAAYTFIILVFKENSYASTVIQVENQQPVITTGPYAIVRHPMYLGMLVLLLCTPLALGSYWAILPFLLAIPLNVLRIQGEEKVLLQKLPGYATYCRQTRYRLVPYIW